MLFRIQTFMSLKWRWPSKHWVNFQSYTNSFSSKVWCSWVVFKKYKYIVKSFIDKKSRSTLVYLKWNLGLEITLFAILIRKNITRKHKNVMFKIFKMVINANKMSWCVGMGNSRVQCFHYYIQIWICSMVLILCCFLSF